MSQSRRACGQCTATTAKGNRCRKRTCRSGLCWQHLKRDSGLRIRPSGVPGAGLGLFAAAEFKRGDVIAPYEGEKLTRRRVDERYGDETAQYVLCRDAAHCVDASASNASAARFANDARGSDKRNNARYRGFNIAATRTVRPGDEILVPYGREYWR